MSIVIFDQSHSCFGQLSHSRELASKTGLPRLLFQLFVPENSAYIISFKSVFISSIKRSQRSIAHDGFRDQHKWGWRIFEGKVESKVFFKFPLCDDVTHVVQVNEKKSLPFIYQKHQFLAHLSCFIWFSFDLTSIICGIMLNFIDAVSAICLNDIGSITRSFHVFLSLTCPYNKDFFKVKI